ncbi:MAG: flavodoxin-dependent (E)-4-hydroxy-3-methylbut-2-enyl-diphosphate synthase [Chitinivibrionia bacterium]|nr:flavodoxin-dependent (E)-4-hydroxy-3-methylbut-2-enyl-diphosphate synthase [Chitinivibrionia bacterium]
MQTSILRRKTKIAVVGDVKIGSDFPISIQSMTNTKTADVEATVAQIRRFEEAGCEIIRITVNDDAAACGFAKIVKLTKLPVVADIHFDYKMALAAIKAGAAKIRINPGNIGNFSRVKEVVLAAKTAGAAIRVGVNSGSLQKDLLKKYGKPTPEALAESAIRYAETMDNLNFTNLVLSIKSTDVVSTIAACEILSSKTDIPQHIGITESGTVKTGAIKSAAGIGAILSRGIGDTIRVSLSGDPVEEVGVAKEILKSLGLRGGPVLIACPTCGRTQINLPKLAESVEERLKTYKENISVAVMGCVVNGPGEAKEADVGVAGGVGEGLLFVKGESVKKVSENQIIDELFLLVDKVLRERK